MEQIWAIGMTFFMTVSFVLALVAFLATVCYSAWCYAQSKPQPDGMEHAPMFLMMGLVVGVVTSITWPITLPVAAIYGVAHWYRLKNERINRAVEILREG